MFYPQSHASWWSAEVQAHYIEGKRVRKWEENPNFPEEMRTKGFLKGPEPLQYQPVGALYWAQALMVPGMTWGCGLI